MNINFNNKKYNPPNNISVMISRYEQQIVITWDIIQGDNIFYNIYYSNSINGIYYKSNQKLLNTNRYEFTIDKNPNTEYFFKVSTYVIFDDNTYTESDLSQPVYYKIKNTNKWFKKMNERNMWILKNTGTLMNLYTVKTTGIKCTHCYNDIREQSFDPNCPVCFGTGFEGGYDPKVQIYMRQRPAQQSLDMTNNGYMLNTKPTFWTISQIHIKKRDILINQEGYLFVVISITPSHIAGYYLHQEFQMEQLQPNHPLNFLKNNNLYPEY